MKQDIVFALRLFRRQPGVMAAIIAGLALAIAVNTATFSGVNALNLRPLGVADPESAVHVSPWFNPGASGVPTTRRGEFGWPYSDYLQLRAAAQLTRVEASVPSAVEIATSDGTRLAVRAPVRFIGGSFFETFGGRAALGRIVGAGDDAPGVAPVAVLGDLFWKSHLGADPGIIGSRLLLDGQPVTIVGVADRRFTGPFWGHDVPVIWLPLASAPLLDVGLGDFRTTSSTTVAVSGRLSAPDGLAAAEAEISRVVNALAAPGGPESPARPVGARLLPARNVLTANDLVSVSAFMLIVGVVLLAACANVANLLLASAEARRDEIALRRALGAGRWRIARQLVTESLLLSVTAGAAASALAALVLAAARLLPLPADADLTLDWRVHGFTLFVSLSVGLAAALAPARHSLRADRSMTLARVAGRGTGAARGHRVRATFIGVQATASMFFLVLAMLFGRALIEAATIALGYDPNRFVTAWVSGRRPGASEARRAEFLELALERARGLAAVTAAALVDRPPLARGGASYAVIGGRRLAIDHLRTSPEYFSTMGLRVTRGRIYEAGEIARADPVAVVSENLADAYALSPGDSLAAVPIRRRPGAPDPAEVRVIGIVTDVVVGDVRSAHAGAIYSPLSKAEPALPHLLIRTTGDAPAALPSLRAALGALAPDLHLEWTPTADRLRDQLEVPRIMAAGMAILTTIALGITVVGIFGVTTFVVAQRRTEVGIRIALGADRWDVRRLLLRDSLVPVVIGLGIGLAAALAVNRTALSGREGVSGLDPLAWVAAAVLLLVPAGVAVLLPARRATRVDPARVLREA